MDPLLKTVATMFSAISQARYAGHMFELTNHGVTCYAPLGRKQDAIDFVKEIQSIPVKAINHVDYPIDKANAPTSNNKDVIALQAALDAAWLSDQTLVFINDGIIVNANGPTDEIYPLVFLLLHTNVAFFEGTFFHHS
ncbi:MAG: hypothetical protein K2X29_06405, partial [Candidatus Obscuribacterales bacterium]|nr:hypothetical protein [Candidatus Obscuribacterales bacterium]